MEGWGRGRDLKKVVNESRNEGVEEGEGRS